MTTDEFSMGAAMARHRKQQELEKKSEATPPAVHRAAVTYPIVNGSNYSVVLPARYAVISTTGKLFDLQSKQLKNPNGVNAEHGHIITGETDDGKPKYLTASSEIVRSESKINADGLGWIPCDADMVNIDNKRLVNTYLGPIVEPKQGEPTMWLDLMRFIWGEYVDLVTGHMAFTVQYPGKKLRWQVLCVSEKKRTGKSSTCEPLKRIFGGDHQVIDQEDISAGWGDYFFGKKVIVVEELYKPGDKSFFNSIKAGLVNSDLEALNLKGGEIVRQQNYRSYYLFTNHWNAINFDFDEDKLLVVQAPEKPWADDFKPYFEALDDSDLVGQVYRYLLEYDLTGFSWDKLPVRTEALARMCRESMADYKKKLIEWAEGRQYPFNGDYVCADAVKEYLHEKRYNKTGDLGIAEALRSAGYEKYKGQRKIDGKVIPTPRFWAEVSLGLDKMTATEIYEWHYSAREAKKVL